MDTEIFEERTVLSNDEELRFSREQGFFDKSIFVRFLIAFLFAISLFSFFHFREVGVEIPEYNSLAPKYVVAQVDFSFVDDEATLILRQEAVRDIGRIYRLSEKELMDRKVQLEQKLLQSEGWRIEIEEGKQEEIYSALDQLQAALSKLRLTDRRTLRKLREIEKEDQKQIYTPVTSDQPTYLPKQTWDQMVEQELVEKEYDPSIIQYLIRHFQSMLWELEEDIPAQKKLREEVQSRIATKYTHVSAGNRIIDQGEKVTARHIAMMQAMKKVLGENRNLWHPLPLIGSLLITLLFTGIFGSYLFVYHRAIMTSNRKFCLLVTIILINLALAKAVEFLLVTTKGNLFELVRYPLLVPLAALLTRNLIRGNVAFFVSAILTFLFSTTLAFETSGFMFLNLITSLAVILSGRSLRRRKEVFIVCGKGWITASLMIIAMHFYENTVWKGAIFADVASSAVFMFLTAVLVLAILPLLESIFRIMSDVTLMEYMDPNHPLLRRLSFEAPGTYQHTLGVCNLSETAALAIGANGLFCRVAALYHDIGKMTTPQYFTENQQGDVDVHRLLTPIESSHAIIVHVSEGVTMARKAGLPEQFIDIIKEHHGTTLVYYFYRKQLDLFDGDKSKVDEKEFRYAGPTPRSKESAIIMIADSFEAASRSLDTLEESNLHELLNRLIRHKAEDGQFEECLLTFEELNIVKKTMIKTFVAASHSRVKYPSREDQEEAIATA